MSQATHKAPRGLKARRPNPRDRTLELEAERLIVERSLLPRESTVLVGVSGGPDSVALLDFVLAWRDHEGVPRERTMVAHVDHGLRGAESDEDARFVGALAEGAGTRFFYERVDLGGARRASPEQAARTLRYRAFRGIAFREGADRVAVAHTADDQAETVLLRLIRGAGLLGLSGMRPARPIHGLLVVRPFLTTSREQVQDYLRRRALASRTDSTNATADARRNYLRLEVIPRIRTMNPGVREALLRGSALFRDVDTYLDGEARRILPEVVRGREEGKITLDVRSLLHYPEVLRNYCFRIVLQELNGDILDLTTAHVQALHSLLTSQPGRIANLAAGISARREREILVLAGREVEPVPTGRPSKS